LITINKTLKEYLVKKCPEIHIKRTTHRYYIEESAVVKKAISEYENSNLSEGNE
jgi:uncharacterized protein (UPF0216 family)